MRLSSLNANQCIILHWLSKNIAKVTTKKASDAYLIMTKELIKRKKDILLHMPSFGNMNLIMIKYTLIVDKSILFNSLTI